MVPAMTRGHDGGSAGSGFAPRGLISAGDSFLGRRGFEAFRRVLEGLREHCPPAFPVVVRTSRLPRGIEGYCKRRRNRFVIHLSAFLGQAAAVDTLVHEWAHAVSWSLLLDRAGDDLQAGRITTEQFEEASHGAEFGTAFAVVWRAFSMKILPGV